MKLMVLILVLISCQAMAGTTVETSGSQKAVKAGLSDIASVRTNITDCLTKLDTAITGTTNALAEAQALPASATKTALVDDIKAQRDLAQAVRQLAQATRDLLQAIRKMERNDQ